MEKQLEFFFDLVSPYSYLAHTRIGDLCERHGAELILRPFLLGAAHKAAGTQAPVEVPNKGKYQLRDLYRWADYYGVTLRFPEPFPFSSLKTMRAATFCSGEGRLEAFTREAFSAYWTEGLNPKGSSKEDEDQPLTEVARRIGADPAELLEGADDPQVKDTLKKTTEEAVERGAFGAPTFFVGGEMFWGNDRLHFVEEALENSAARR